MNAKMSPVYPEQPDNQRFMRVPLRDEQAPVVRGGLLPGEPDTPLRDYYKYELAAKYEVGIKFFVHYYLHVPEVLSRLEGLGYDPKKTKLLSRGMVKVLFEIHGKP